MNVDLNEVLISGIINNVTDNNQDYIKFGLTTLKYDRRKVYASLNINRNLYEIHKDFFVKGTKVFIKGYLNSYVDKNTTIKSFITVTEISDSAGDILKGRIEPCIRIDSDGVEVWNGKREKSIQPTEDELNKLEERIQNYR